MQFRFILVTVVGLLSTSLGVAQTKYSNEFLKIGVGARALGMSNAFVAATDDVNSSYWNPAGLVRMQDDFQVSLMHSEYFAGIAAYNFGSFATKLDDQSAIAFSVVRFGVDDIPNTTQLIDNEGNIDFDRVTLFSVADYAGLISYARKSNVEGLSYGANVKIVRRIIGDFASAWGFGFDVGAQYQTGDWTFGATGRDITSTFNAWDANLDEETEEIFVRTGNELPGSSVEITVPELVLGINRRAAINDKFAVQAELDLNNTFDGKRNTLIKSNFVSIDPSIGAEVSYVNAIYLRMGVGNFQVTTDISGNRITTLQPNFGIGLKLSRFNIDYAFTNIGDLSIAQNSNVFSVRVDINRNQ